MATEMQQVRNKPTALLAVVKRGATIYLKIPKDINDSTFGFEQGDNVQIEVVQLTHKGRPKR